MQLVCLCIVFLCIIFNIYNYAYERHNILRLFLFFFLWCVFWYMTNLQLYPNLTHSLIFLWNKMGVGGRTILTELCKGCFLLPYFSFTVAGWPWLDTMYLPSHFITHFLSKNILMGQDKGSLMKQKQMPCMEAKENKRFVLYFPSLSNVQQLPGKQDFSTPCDFFRRQAQ